MTAPMATQPATTVADVLDKAADLIAAPGAWTQGRMARTADGTPVRAQHEMAACWCVVGALCREGSGSSYSQAVDLLDSMVPPRFHQRSMKPVAVWNDEVRRTQSQVVRLLREAAAKARAQVSA